MLNGEIPLQRSKTPPFVSPSTKANNVGEVTDRPNQLLQVLLAGPRLLCGSLASTILGFRGHEIQVECLLSDTEDKKESEHWLKQNPCNSGEFNPNVSSSTMLVLLLVCCCIDDLSSLLGSPLINPFLPNQKSESSTVSVVLISSGKDQSTLLPVWSKVFGENIRVWVSINAGEADLREAIIAASKGCSFFSNDSVASMPLMVSEETTTPDISIAHIPKASWQKQPKKEQETVIDCSSLANRKGGATPHLSMLQQDAKKQRTCSSPLGKIHSTHYNLTLCEEQTARLAAEGSSNAEIAERLCIKIATVKSHLQSVFNKTDTRRRGQLIKLFA